MCKSTPAYYGLHLKIPESLHSCLRAHRYQVCVCVCLAVGDCAVSLGDTEDWMLVSILYGFLLWAFGMWRCACVPEQECERVRPSHPAPVCLKGMGDVPASPSRAWTKATLKREDPVSAMITASTMTNPAPWSGQVSATGFLYFCFICLVSQIRVMTLQQQPWAGTIPRGILGGIWKELWAFLFWLFRPCLAKKLHKQGPRAQGCTLGKDKENINYLRKKSRSNLMLTNFHWDEQMYHRLREILHHFLNFNVGWWPIPTSVTTFDDNFQNL